MGIHMVLTAISPGFTMVFHPSFTVEMAFGSDHGGNMGIANLLSHNVRLQNHPAT